MENNKDKVTQFSISVEFNYLSDELDDSSIQELATGKEFNQLDVSGLDRPLKHSPQGQRINTESEAYRNFVEAVNTIDELMELHTIQVVGESEGEQEDAVSAYRRIVFNVVKDVNDIHYSGKVENFLRVSNDKEPESSRRNRADKPNKALPALETRRHNDEEPLEFGEFKSVFQSIMVRASVSDPSKTNISNTEFHSVADAVQFIDELLKSWGLVSE